MARNEPDLPISVTVTQTQNGGAPGCMPRAWPVRAWEGFRAIKTVFGLVASLPLAHALGFALSFAHELNSCARWRKQMNTNQTLLLQALKAKQIQSVGHNLSGHMIDKLLDSSEEVKTKMHNICAFITTELHGEITALSDILDLSKRQIVEMALVDFVAKAHATIDEVDVFEFRLKGKTPEQGE